MAESIIVHFSDVEADRIIETLNGVGVRTGNTWSIPSKEEYRILVYQYDDYLEEYDKHEKYQVENSLGSQPTISYCIELRRSVQNEACELSKKIINISLATYNFVIDDCLGEVWRKSDIDANENEFLKSYCHK